MFFLLMYAASILGKRLKSSLEYTISTRRMFKGLDYYHHILTAEYENIDSESGKSRIDAGMKSYFDDYHKGFHHIILDFRALIEAMLGFILYCSVIAYQVNMILPVFLVALSSLSILTNILHSKWIYRNKDNWSKIDVKLGYLSTQTISIDNAKDIRMFSMRAWLSSCYDSLTAKRLHWLKKETVQKQLVQFFERVLIGVKYIAIFVAVLHEIRNGLSASNFVLLFGLMTGMNVWMKQIFDNIKYLQSNNILVNHSRCFLEIDKDTKEEKRNSPIQIKKIDFKQKLELKDVSFSFQNTDEKIYDHFNLTIKKGEKLAIVGLNGAGKTTLVKLLCGLYSADSGNIYLDGVDIQNCCTDTYMAVFSAMFQDSDVYAISIKEFVACCTEEKINREKVKQSLFEAGLLEKINQLKNGMDSILLKELDEEGVVFSGGEIQRLLLARCLYKDAQIIILDEPTAAADALFESELYEKFASLTEGKTSIFVSHRLSSTKFCDRIIMLDKGQIIEEGTHEELKKANGAYAKIYSLQAQYYERGDCLES